MEKKSKKIKGLSPLNHLLQTKPDSLSRLAQQMSLLKEGEDPCLVDECFDGAYSPLEIILLQVLQRMARKGKESVERGEWIALNVMLEYVNYSNVSQSHQHQLISRACESELLLEKILKSQIGVNARSADGLTPLHRALKREQWPCVQILLHFGAHVEARTAEGLTPLMIAVKGEASSERLNALKSLLNAGAKISPIDHEGRSVFHHIQAYQQEGREGSMALWLMKEVGLRKGNTEEGLVASGIDKPSAEELQLELHQETRRHEARVAQLREQLKQHPGGEKSDAEAFKTDELLIRPLRRVFSRTGP